VFAAEEAFVGAEGRGVGGFEDKMFSFVHEGLLFLGEFAPEEEDGVFFLCRDLCDHRVGEFCPADLGMAHGFVRADGKGSVEEEDALFGPVGEIAVVGDGHADVGVQFFEYIDEGGWGWDAFLDREAEAVGLAGAVVGVLAEEDDLDFVEGGCVEGVEDESAGGVDGAAGCPFGFEVVDDLEEIRFGEFGFEDLFPAFFDLYLHR